MHFQLTEEQEMMRKMVREFAETEVAPGAAERDEAARFDRRLFERMGELGLTGIPWPEKYGGADAGFVSYCIAVEELARVDASLSDTWADNVTLNEASTRANSSTAIQ